MIVIEIERRRTDLHRHARHNPLGLRGQQVAGRPQRWNRGPAAQTDQIVQNGVAPKAELFGHVAGDARAKVTRAGADKERIKLLRSQVGCGQRPAKRQSGELRRRPTKRRVQFVLRQTEDPPDVAHREMTGIDAAASGENGTQHEL